MKRLPLIKTDVQADSATSGDRRWYQTLAERDGDAAIETKRVTEFEGDRPFEPPPGVDRRTFMSLMGASMALAGLAGCRRPEEKILPYTKRPEDLIPGKSEYFATTLPFYGTALGLLVESVDGRPIKIEGNPDHPETLGGSTAYVQASVLDLYDPDRSQVALKDGKQLPSNDEAIAALAKLGADAKAKQGLGLAILVGEHRSPTTSALLGQLLNELPRATVQHFEPFGRDSMRRGATIAFGDVRDTVLAVDAADVVVALDADILGTEGSPIKASKGFARRRRNPGADMSRWYVAEPCPSITGMGADHRVRVKGRDVAEMLKALATELMKGGLSLPQELAPALTSVPLGDKVAKFVAASAHDLLAKKGKGLVVVGRRQPQAVHALAAALNVALGNAGTTVKYPSLGGHLPEGPFELRALAEQMRNKAIESVVFLGVNPVLNAPADVGFADAMKGLTTIHIGLHADETALASSWHIPRAHVLESWSDAVSEDFAFSITQPLIAPMYEGLTDAEAIDRLLGRTTSAYDLVTTTWRKLLADSGVAADGFDKAFRTVLHDGVLKKGPALPPTVLDLKAVDVATALGSLRPVDGAFEVLFAPDPHAYDGRFANNGWLMELPDPIHKGTWMTFASISHASAQKLGVVDGDHVEVTVGNAKTSVPVAIAFGHADDSITLPVGLGRTLEWRVARGVGVNVNPLRTAAGWDIGGGSVVKGGKHERPSITQGHFVMEGRPLIRTQSVAEHAANPDALRDAVPHPPLLNLWKDWDYNGHKWGMAIDLTLCTGCSACVTACQAENNIPVLGIEGVIRSREMHWLRIDRYFAGRDGVVEGADEADAATMPMTCQHCENAPCEQVCPVAATTHSPEGINEMTYNRCIGTKYCANNCPYKVRRFNYFNYNKDLPESHKLVLNPDVTVRSRGVMEKCTFCVQRVNQAKISAKKEKDAEKARDLMRRVQSACMQACPTEAITFGDLNDGGPRPDGRTPVGMLANEKRAYKMLEELNVRPRISYLNRIRNPHPSLEGPKPAGGVHAGHGDLAPHGDAAPHGAAAPNGAAAPSQEAH